MIIASNLLSYYRSQDLNKEKLSFDSFKLIDNTEYIVQKDKPIIIHFWATWCPICKIEASNIEKLSKDYEVITIAIQSPHNDIIEYLKDNDLTFNVVEDFDGGYLDKFKVKVFPTTFIYDKDKVLKFSEVGYTSTAGLYSRMALIK